VVIGYWLLVIGLLVIGFYPPQPFWRRRDGLQNPDKHGFVKKYDLS